MDEEPQVSTSANVIGGLIFTLLVIVAICLVFATIGALAAITVESFQWFRESLNWV